MKHEGAVTFIWTGGPMVNPMFRRGHESAGEDGSGAAQQHVRRAQGWDR